MTKQNKIGYLLISMLVIGVVVFQGLNTQSNEDALEQPSAKSELASAESPNSPSEGSSQKLPARETTVVERQKRPSTGLTYEEAVEANGWMVNNGFTTLFSLNVPGRRHRCLRGKICRSDGLGTCYVIAVFPWKKST